MHGRRSHRLAAAPEPIRPRFLVLHTEDAKQLARAPLHLDDAEKTMKHATIDRHSKALTTLLSISILSMAACSGEGPTGPIALSDGPADVTVTLNVSSLDFHEIGASAQLHASVNGSDESPRWESSNSGVAIIDEDGLVTAVGGGLAIVRVYVGSSYAEAVINVSPLDGLYDQARIGR